MDCGKSTDVRRLTLTAPICFTEADACSVVVSDISKLLYHLLNIHHYSFENVTSNPKQLKCKSCFLPAVGEHAQWFFNIGRRETDTDFVRLTREEIIGLSWKPVFDTKCEELEVEDKRDFSKDPVEITNVKVHCFRMNVEYNGRAEYGRPLFCEEEEKAASLVPSILENPTNFTPAEIGQNEHYNPIVDMNPP